MDYLLKSDLGLCRLSPYIILKFYVNDAFYVSGQPVQTGGFQFTNPKLRLC